MLIDERRQHILGLVQNNGRVLVHELSGTLGISQITIRLIPGYVTNDPAVTPAPKPKTPEKAKN